MFVIDDDSFRELLHAARIKCYNFSLQHFVARPIRTVYTVPVAVRSEVGVCGLSLAGIAVSNPAVDMDVSLL
jgi:hypothetical protein